ncbi:hypothetical protein V8E51_001184 [Hyaloscypha variabilis]
MRYIERLAEGSVSARRPWNWKQGRAINALTERRYWKRIWIVQEIMLAKEIRVFCGERSVSWSCFSMLQELLQNIQNYGRMEHIPFAWPVFGSAALRIVSKSSAWKLLPLETNGLPIEDVLEDFADMESTELKDKVYALLGIIQPFEDCSSILIDYSKTTAAIYRDVLRHVFYHNENLDVPAKQRFKKLLKKSLGLGAINVMERETVTEARILIAVEERAQVVMKSIETQAVVHFRSRESELNVPLQKAVEYIVECEGIKIGPSVWDYCAFKAIHKTAIDPEITYLLEEVAERERVTEMDNAERYLSATLEKHLRDSCELGVETTMRWVQESRFEVDSLISSVDERWRREYTAAWIYKWRRREIKYRSSREDRARIKKWMDDWYHIQVDHMNKRMSLSKMVRDYLTEHNRRYGTGVKIWFYWYGDRSSGKPDDGFYGAVFRWIKDWHKQNGVFDLSSVEIRTEIEEKMKGLLQQKYPMPDL